MRIENVKTVEDVIKFCRETASYKRKTSCLNDCPIYAKCSVGNYVDTVEETLSKIVAYNRKKKLKKLLSQ